MQFTSWSGSPAPLKCVRYRVEVPPLACNRPPNQASSTLAARMGLEHDLVDEPGRRHRGALEHRAVPPSHAVDTDANNSARSKRTTCLEPPARTRVISRRRTVVRVREGIKVGLGVRICKVYNSRVVQEHEPCSSGVMELASKKCSGSVQRLSQHIGGVIRQPAGMSQSVTWSVVQAAQASHGTTGSARKAAGQAAHLQRRRSAR